MMLLILFCSVFITFQGFAANGASTTNELVSEVYVNMPLEQRGLCFRVLNGTHQFGCQSSRWGNEGVVVRISSSPESLSLDDAAECWKTHFGDDNAHLFMVAIDEHLLNQKSIGILSRTECINGVLILATNQSAKPDERSDDGLCPNIRTSLYNDSRSCAFSASDPDWNERTATHDGLAFIDWQKPVVTVANQTTIQHIDKCFESYNRQVATDSSHQLCALSMKVFSNAAGTSAMCIRRQQPGPIDLDNVIHLCDPLQDKNVFAVIPPVAVRGSEKNDAEYLMIAARLDSFGLIWELSPGHISVLTSLISLLAAARVVGDNLSAFESASNRTNKRLVFALFHGESFDYIGSGRTVYDMTNNAFPYSPPSKEPPITKDVMETIKLNQIAAILELQQVDEHKTFYAHVDGESYRAGQHQIDSLLTSLSRELSHDSIDLMNTSLSHSSTLPPSSIHSFLRKRRTTPAVLIAPFNKQYLYGNVNSMRDRHFPSTSPVRDASIRKTIASLARAVAYAAADFVGVSQKNLTVDEEWIATLYDCFVVSADWHACRYFNETLSSLRGIPLYENKKERSTYIGADGLSMVRILSYPLLIRATGEHRSTENVRSEGQCQQIDNKQMFYNYVWQLDPEKNESYCYRTTVFTKDALSPIFINQEQVADVNMEETEYSTWVESYYAIKDMQLFLVDTPPMDRWMLVIGVLLVALSTMIVLRFDDSSFVVDEGEAAAEHGEPL